MATPVISKNGYRVIYGVGLNDAGYQTQLYRDRKLVLMCPYYKKWKSMLARCYSKGVHKTRSTYIGCSVCDEWLLFSNFKSWLESHNLSDAELSYLHLDKDILLKGNKVYSPDRCALVHPRVNAFVYEGGGKKSKYKLGVFYDKDRGKFSAKCQNPITLINKRLGKFDTEDEAHLAYMKRKNEFSQLLIDDLKLVGPVADALADRYKV